MMRAKITMWEKYQQEWGFVLSIPWVLFIYIYILFIKTNNLFCQT